MCLLFVFVVSRSQVVRPGEDPPGREGLPLAAQRGPHGGGEAVGRHPQVRRRRRQAGDRDPGTEGFYWPVPRPLRRCRDSVGV